MSTATLRRAALSKRTPRVRRGWPISGSSRHCATTTGWHTEITAALKQRAAFIGSPIANSPAFMPSAMISPRYFGHSAKMPIYDRPMLFERDRHHLMDLDLADHLRDRRLVFLDNVGLQFFTRRDRPLRKVEQRDFSHGQHTLGQSFVDLGLRGVKAINVGGRHAEFARDVGDRGLRVPVMPKQTLRLVENPRRGVDLGVVLFGGSRGYGVHGSMM